jgi:dihydrofolate synthase/folylpolyglutamate synthase
MNYSQSLSYLNSFYDLEKTMTLPAERRWKLERMRHLLKIFGQPQKSFSSVVIVGTKGKGSTGFFLQSILKEAGIPAGFYSSPHLESPRERIRINGEMIPTPLWCRLLNVIHRELASRQKTPAFGAYTYFEIMTLMAALAFKEAGVKAAVFEAGMGGRLDAVNALGAPIVIVTPIHLDHQEFLGNTITKIAAEKAAVIHSGTDVVMAPQSQAAKKVILTCARKMRARLWPVTQKVKCPIGLLGDHQQWNAAVAVKAAKILQSSFFPDKRERVKKAISRGLAASDWPGRFEVLRGRPRIILDGAHNPAAIQVLVKTLSETFKTDFGGVLIFGVTKDKDSKTMLKRLARIFSTIIVVPLHSPRGKPTAELLQEARCYFPVQVPAADLEEAVRLGKHLAGSTGTLVVTGSFYLIGDFRLLAN